MCKTKFCFVFKPYYFHFSVVSSVYAIIEEVIKKFGKQDHKKSKTLHKSLTWLIPQWKVSFQACPDGFKCRCYFWFSPLEVSLQPFALCLCKFNMGLKLAQTANIFQISEGSSMLLMRAVSPAMTMQFSVQQFKGFCTVNWSPWVRLPMSSSSVTCWGVWEETLSGNELNCGVCQLVRDCIENKEVFSHVHPVFAHYVEHSLDFASLKLCPVEVQVEGSSLCHMGKDPSSLQRHKWKGIYHNYGTTGNRTSAWKWSWLGIQI